MKTRKENLAKNKKIKKRVRIEKIAKPMIEIFPKEKDREALFKKLYNSNVCISLGIFHSAIIIWTRDENVRKITLTKLAGLRKVRSKENKYIFVTSPKYNMKILERIVRGIVEKIRQEREQGHARSFIIFLISHQGSHRHFTAAPCILYDIYSNCQ